MVRLRRIRGLRTRHYVIAAAIGVVSTFYIMKPSLDKLEEEYQNTVNRQRTEKDDMQQ